MTLQERAKLDALVRSNKYDAEIHPRWFHDGQKEIWRKREDIVLALCGTQSGKTVLGPWWLLREIQRMGCGDFLVGGPSLELLSKKVVPEMKRVLRQFGTFTAKPWVFNFSAAGLKRLGLPNEPTVIYFGHGDDPDSMESMTLKAAWFDECGQKSFKRGSYEAIQRRLAIHKGRLLLTSTPYEWDWLKYDVYDAWVSGADYIGVVNFKSTMNPTFPQERYDRAQESLPPWKHEMMYDGKFTKPAGMIYDCFERNLNTCARFRIPRNWRRFQGVDFGMVNTASVFAAMDPKTLKIVVYRSYHEGGRSAAEHGAAWTDLEESFYEQSERIFDPNEPLNYPITHGGAPSEDDWRERFGEASLSINRPPYSDVETGIERVYKLLKNGRLKFFNDLTKLIAEIETYSREVNDQGEAIDKIDKKSEFHRLDALRYLCSGIPDEEQGEPLQEKRSVGTPVKVRPLDEDDEDDEPERVGRFSNSRRRDSY